MINGLLFLSFSFIWYPQSEINNSSAILTAFKKDMSEHVVDPAW